MAKAIEVTGLTVAVRGGAPIISDVSLHLDSGEVMGVVGESGSGKSTLALALLGFARPGASITSGSVTIDGRDLLSLPDAQLRAMRGRTVAYVPQDPATALNPSLSLATQLTEGLDADRSRALATVRELLVAVGLPSDDAFLRRRPRELSGGQQQRVAIAMAMAAAPRLIVFDEPTTGLDVSTQARVLELVRDLCHSRRMAAVYVSHDLAVVAEVADAVTVMYAGEIVESGPSMRVITRPTHPYTRALLDAVPSMAARHRLVPIPGRAAGVGEIDQGCRFVSRCTFAVDACHHTHPPLTLVDADTDVRCLRATDVAAAARTSQRISDERVDVPGEQPALAVSRLAAGYAGRQILFDVSFELGRGECLAVVGESGSGKTTMSRCLIGLHEEQTGEFQFEGAPMPALASRRSDDMRRGLQYVFQNPYGSLNPRKTIEASLTLPLQHFFGVDRDEARQRAADALERVEIPARYAQRYAADLSGGQRQRVAIARALVCEPRVLLCDEVTSALDVSVQASVIELLRSLLDEGLSMVFVTHNLAVVRSIADKVVVLNKGHLVESGPTEAVLSAPTHDYTRALMADTLDVPEARSA
ncbi:dipeptide ABC transporter ATP-binding protein [Microbacterium sp.]|uniref:dipeptide ABC transporter ATP-binding protein n=1 Tax=Microbacterium sp. TaxID=51671 RepID=UPI0039E4BFD0